MSEGEPEATTNRGRDHEIVLFGATGFTGQLTAEYLARHAPPGTRWALAGRNLQKLEGVRRALAEIDPTLSELSLLQADVTDLDSVRAVAESTQVVITTVGPYIHYGEALVAACAAAGTDYVDLTGEPEFVDRMWLGYHDRAQRSGARIIHSCGFDSIPYDLGVLFTVNQLPEGVPIHIDGFVRAGGTFSGGTYHSAVHIMGRLRQGAAVAKQRRTLEPRPVGRTIRGAGGLPHRDADAGGWVLPAPTIDPQHVLRSARALHRYGPDFSYGHYLVLGKLPMLAGFAAGACGVIAAAQLAPTRKLLLKLKDPGDGPTPEQRAKAWFKVKFVARTGGEGGERVVTEVSGGDPGYGETSKMLAECALCLAKDDLPETSGQVTTAVAMGQALIDRLVRAGIEFRVLQGGRP
ncbi:MAG: saccharopine dehydrogenase NADP-binding domain-containing protein [Actinomycetota bacterium]|nr:saccharopine dehydrogenase NADP-binding domain-containing protein [Actinomycetota bacterium]